MDDLLKWCLIGFGVITILTIILFLIVNSRKKDKVIKENQQFSGMLVALGGAENISNVNLNGSRISLNFIDKNLIVYL